MKVWEVIFDASDELNFSMIVSGEKIVETRALDETDSAKDYYRAIDSGDAIRFVCGTDSVIKNVVEARYYPTLADYLEYEDLELALGEGMTAEKATDKLHGYPGYKERIKKYGLVVWELD